MNKVFTVIFLLASIAGFSQAQNKGTLSFNTSFDFGLHGTVSEYYYNGTLIDQDTSAAGTKLFRIDAHYNILKFLSVGLKMRTGSYIEDPDNAEANGNKVSMFGLGVRAYPVNTDKFALYLGLNYGASNLEINRIYTFIVASNHRYIWKSPHFSADLGFNWYFGKSVGMNFSLGYSGHNFDLKEYYIDGNLQDLSNQRHVFITKGVHIGLGVAFKFLGDK